MTRWLLPLLSGLALTFMAADLGGADTLTVVTLNIWHDQRDWPRRRAMILDELRALRPDVICLQEVLQHATLRNQAEDVADSLGHRFTFSSVDPDTSVKRYGNAILSRHPVLETRSKALDPANDYRTVAHMRIDFRGRPVDVFDTHLHHTPKGGAIRAEQIRDLLAFVQSHRGDGPIVLAGDFNAPPHARELKPVLGEFVDVFGVLHSGSAGRGVTTLNAAMGHKRRRIDYVFIDRNGASRLRPLASEVVFDVPAADGTWPSDHFGVVARLLVAP